MINQKKWIKLCNEGLQQHEIKAISTIENNFIKEEKKSSSKTRLKDFISLKQQTYSELSWKGYAGFRLAVNKNEGEYDLLIFTHCNILIIELKNWNGKISCSKGHWYQNEEDRGKSPVAVTRNKFYLIKEKLRQINQKSQNKYSSVYIEYLVVMTGKATFINLPDDEKKHVMSLQYFLELKDEEKFRKKFNIRNDATYINPADLAEEFFKENRISPQFYRINGYKAEKDALFVHPKEIYKEYLAQSENIKTDLALIRRWDFNRINDDFAKTSDGRYSIIKREYEVLEHIKIANEDLFNNCLNHKSPPSKDNITSEYTDIFTYLPSNKSFNIYIEQNAKNLSKEQRLELVFLMLSKLADLHKIGIAHRDINYHSIWIANTKKITFSNFISAYYPEKGTIGNIREILSVSGVKDLAFEYFPISKPTPFIQDIRSATVLAWHIINSKSILPDSIKKFAEEIKTNNEWYADIFRKALSEQPFIDGKAFFDAFNERTQQQSYIFQFDENQLNSYKHPYNHNIEYSKDTDTEYLKFTDDKEVYRSNGQVVKAWLNIHYKNNKSAAQILLNFLKQVSQLKDLAPDYLPTIREFGIADRSSSLFIVSEYIEGYTWKEIQSKNLDVKNKYKIIYKLIQAIEHLHSLNLYHGDLHPENIKILDDNNNAKVYLLDLIDYTSNGKSNLNYYYSPPTAEEASEQERDNFAVMRMACELLNISWGEESSKFPEIAKVIKLECSDRETGFLSLERFKKALQPTQKNSINIKGQNSDSQDIKIFPDENKLFIVLSLKKDIKNKINIDFYGIGGLFHTVYNLNTQCFDSAKISNTKVQIPFWVKKKSNLSIPFSLEISGNQNFDLTELTKKLLNWPEFNHKISIFKQTNIEQRQLNLTPPYTNDSTNLQHSIDNLSEISFPITNLTHQLSVRNLWTAIISKETDSLPYVKAVIDYKENQNSPKIRHDENNNKWFVFYESGDNTQILDQFRADDKIFVLVKNNKNKERTMGQLDLQFCTSYYLCFKEKPKFINCLKTNPIMYLQNWQTFSSLRRRKKAVERILAGESIISQLPEYFEANCTLPCKNYDIKIGEEEFRLYDRDNGYGEIVTLNSAQRYAFAKLIQNGPLSLLQGPPGTGKTEFIAAFVHFLFTQQNVQKILLVSQSHEAVNTAAERIRKHCQRLKEDISIVRFSNRETAVSTDLQDVFSLNLVGAQREILQATQINRICEIGQILGLSEDYLKLRTELQLNIGKQIKRLERLKKPIPKEEQYDVAENQEYIAESSNLCNQIYEYICFSLEAFIGKNKNIYTDKILLDINKIDTILISLIEILDHYYRISPKQSAQADNLIELTDSMQQALSNEGVNYDEFLARSRQLVIGTCVGIGHDNIEIDQNIYDWVIIDEAARSMSSELAIAMQSAKRILLVGDHKQLPPLYSEEHKKALMEHYDYRKSKEEFEQQFLSSDFQRVFDSPYGQHTCATLKTQYRMAPAIGTLVSNCFYAGELENGRLIKDVPNIYRLIHQHFSSCVTWLDTSNLPNSNEQKKDEHGRLFNEAEADIIIEHLRYLETSTDFKQSDIVLNCLKKGEAAIGIICMYSEQKNLIRKKFNETKWDEQFRQLIKIDTVDSYQGKENRIIMLSITRNNKILQPGFLNSPNRINVALSRAMDRLIIVGATAMWRGKNADLPLGKVLAMMESNEDKLAYSIIKFEKNKQ